MEALSLQQTVMGPRPLEVLGPLTFVHSVLTLPLRTSFVAPDLKSLL